MQSFQKKKKVNKKSGQTLYHNGPAVPAGGEEEGFFPAAVMKCDRLSGAASIQAGTQKHTYCSKSWISILIPLHLSIALAAASAHVCKGANAPQSSKESSKTRARLHVSWCMCITAVCKKRSLQTIAAIVTGPLIIDSVLATDAY